MKRSVLLFTVTLLLTAGISAQSITTGGTLDDFTLSDIGGKTRTLNELKGSNGTLIVFLSAQCPTVKAYNERIKQIAADYSAKGINVVGLNANATESADWVKSHAAEVGYKFPVLIDKGSAIADKLGAGFTPEVFLLNAKNVLVYQGAIDNDRFGRGNVTEPFLRAAFDAHLSGKKIERPVVPAFGCDIKRKAK